MVYIAIDPCVFFIFIFCLLLLESSFSLHFPLGFVARSWGLVKMFSLYGLRASYGLRVVRTDRLILCF